MKLNTIYIIALIGLVVDHRQQKKSVSKASETRGRGVANFYFTFQKEEIEKENQL